MNQDIPLYDVVQVGYGPVSEILALALARQGHRVAVFERWTERYPLPRAVCIDHELYRVLSALGMGRQLPSVSHAGPQYRWFNAEWKELLSIDWSAESISGGPEVHFIHQPTLETMFDEAVRARQEVELNLGWEAIEVTQTSDYAQLVVRQVETGQTRIVRAKYLVGADGANSIVREAIGSPQEDRGFEADWLVIDVLPHEGVTLDVPPAAQYCNPVRPTTIVPAGVKDGRYFRRWEFMRLPHEARQDLEAEGVAWELLAPWVTPQQATIVRHKVYSFRSLLADTWRKGRLLIAGDAAHVMPPFMGQGMCAGLRDDWNLAWKLDLVLNGEAHDSLLDTYQPERRPHVSDVIDLSMYLGKVICIPDADKAAERDAAFLSGQAAPPPAFPCLTDGLLRRALDGSVQSPAGMLAPHGKVRTGDRVGRFDDVVGLGFALVSRSAATQAALGEGELAFLRRIRATSVVIVEPGSIDGPIDGLTDVDGKFLPWMARMGIATMLVRPDFHVYGAVAEGADVNELVGDLARDLARYGVGLASTHEAPLLAHLHQLHEA
jgi:2-polyprenyl-6-methoxyphenol hydroxylase-like FAD-dependent oxidoreductase